MIKNSLMFFNQTVPRKTLLGRQFIYIFHFLFWEFHYLNTNPILVVVVVVESIKNQTF